MIQQHLASALTIPGRGEFGGFESVGGLWEVLGGFGRFWRVSGGFGRFWEVLGGFGGFWRVLGGFGV